MAGWYSQSWEETWRKANKFQFWPCVPSVYGTTILPINGWNYPFYLYWRQFLPEWYREMRDGIAPNEEKSEACPADGRQRPRQHWGTEEAAAASGYQSRTQAGSRPAARMSLRPPGASAAYLLQVQELGQGGHQLREVYVGTTVALGEGSLVEPEISQLDCDKSPWGEGLVSANDGYLVSVNAVELNLRATFS